MEEETKAPTEQTAEPTANADQKPNNIDAIERKNRELLGKLKSEKEKREELAARLDKIEQERLESQGKYQDINKTLKEKLEQTERQANEQINRFRLQLINSALKSSALQAGCKKPEAVLRLLEKNEKEMIQVDDSFNVDTSSISTALNRIKEEYPMLFEKTSVPTKDVPPTTDIPSQAAGKSDEQLLEDYINSLK